MRHAISLVDAFADRPFAGNPAAVMILDAPLPDALMQDVAAEMAQAETAFAVPRAGGGWDLRWFSPTREVPFCGHATLATAHVLHQEGRAGGLLAFHTAAGVLRVGVEEGGRYALDLPRQEPRPLDPARLGRLVPGLSDAFEAGGNAFAVLRSEAEVVAFRPDGAAIAAALGEDGLCITAPGQATDIASRYFWPQGGIPEDAVTGSAHAALVPWWAARLGRDRLSARQASRRGGRLDCHLAHDRVHLTGRAVTVLHGHLHLPD